jgi:phosphate transport system substrate-binding protein
MNSKKKYLFSGLAGALVLAGAITVVSCKDGEAVQEETMTAGTISIQVDYSVQPVVEDALAIFQSIYPKAHITQVNRNEADIVQALLNDSAQVAVITRELTDAESAHFAKTGIKARTVPFAKDGLALIAAPTVTDTLINLEDIYKLMRGDEPGAVKQLVFDSNRAGIAQYLIAKAGNANKSLKNVYSLKNTAEVFTFVKNNPGAIGVVGVNWLLQPPAELEQAVKQVKVLAVSKKSKGTSAKDYFKPSQVSISEGNYPLTRTLYLLNYQGKKGLGTGFATYLSAPDGQRLILKSGLLPVTLPYREIEIVNK